MRVRGDPLVLTETESRDLRWQHRREYLHGKQGEVIPSQDKIPDQKSKLIGRSLLCIFLRKRNLRYTFRITEIILSGLPVLKVMFCVVWYTY